eukprot:1138237-Pelagomonas_calceolata.AAC.2
MGRAPVCPVWPEACMRTGWAGLLWPKGIRTRTEWAHKHPGSQKRPVLQKQLTKATKPSKS